MRLLPLACLLMTAAVLHASAPAADTLPPHPRLLATAADFDRIRGSVTKPGPLKDAFGILQKTADREYSEPPVERIVVGRRLLDTSRTAFRRIVNFSLLYRLTGDLKWAARSEKEMLALAAFSDWHPDHFLDTAEAAAAQAIGYDWIYDTLSPASRLALRESLVRHALNPGDSDAPWWRSRRPANNWLQVCESGLTLAALAVAEDEPELSARAVARARKNVPAIFPNYEPSGSYVEGPMYWDYGTTYQLLLIESLRTATGSSGTLAANPAFLQSAAVVHHLTAPSGNVFNFGDCSLRRSFMPAMYWFARETRSPALVAGEASRLRDLQNKKRSLPDRFFALSLLWMPDGPLPEPVALPASWSTLGENPLAVFRAGRGPGSLYAAIKGGRARSSHAHMDAGSFILELGGVRWAIDLGMPVYHDLEKQGIALFGKDRWSVFILGAGSHSVPLIDDQFPDENATATLSAFDPGTQSASVDLSPLYARKARELVRTLRVMSPASIRIEDRLQGAKPGSRYRFSWMTRAAVTTDATGATLSQDGKTLRLDITADSAFTVVNEDAARPPAPHDAPQPGLRRISVLLPVTGSEHTVTVTARLLAE